MEHMGDAIMKSVLILAAIFGPLSLGAFLVKSIVQRIKERRRQRRIESYLRHLPLVERPTEGPRYPRVLYSPKVDPEAGFRTPRQIREAESETVLLPVPVVVGWDYAAPQAERTEVFTGKGGQSGGAGASGEWETDSKPVIAETVAPEPTTTTFETSEPTIAEPEAPASE